VILGVSPLDNLFETNIIIKNLTKQRFSGRLVRLVPANNGRDAGMKAIKRLLNYRLPKDDTAAKIEWLDIVEGRHEYWKDIPSEKKELLRSFFIFVSQIAQVLQAV